MDDRKLLELAAKAAGMNFIKRGMAGGNPLPGELWNPLKDDGDALRLAVKLGIHITISEYGKTVTRARSEFRDVQDHGGDPYAATRRAIVRAAAALAGGYDD